MANVTSRKQLIDYCLRRLGAPVINIEVDDDQVDDRVDDALIFYQKYHYDGTERLYMKYQITQEDFDRKYIEMPTNIASVVQIFPMGMMNQASIWDVRYQMALSDLYYFGSIDLNGFATVKMHMEMMQQLLSPEKSFQFNKSVGKIVINTDWVQYLPVGTWILLECYAIIDPEANVAVYNDPNLKDYVTALIKEQWGQNLSKFQGVAMVGGVQFDGVRILSEAKKEIEEIENEIISSNQQPPDFLIG
jgi:hypothetical protein